MTIDVRGGQTANLSDRVAEEIRALLGRRRMSQAELARKMGTSGAWLNYRLTGKQPIDVNDLDEIAAALDVAVTDLLPRRVPTDQLPARPFAPGIARPSRADHRPAGRHDSARPAGRPSNVRRRAA